MSEDLLFRKSSYSGSGNNCVEVADFHSGTAVRDSQIPADAPLTFTREAWQAFVDEVKRDRL